jgi:protein TonB
VIGTLDGPVASPAPPNPPAAIQPSFPHGGPVLEPVALPADIEPARLLSPVIPEYPYDARRAAASGIVRLEVRLKRSGEVEFLRVIEGPGHGLNEAARDAVKRTRCSPARRKGEPIDVTATVRVVFRLA